ncbi:MAG: hypothetical protein LBE38_02990 [Deltaproteobacteria bacterium]|jgi:hypothetical protein|nr:hypothetical protein [Deltaproteobacteria bacterium]
MDFWRKSSKAKCTVLEEKPPRDNPPEPILEDNLLLGPTIVERGEDFTLIALSPLSNPKLPRMGEVSLYFSPPEGGQPLKFAAIFAGRTLKLHFFLEDIPPEEYLTENTLVRWTQEDSTQDNASLDASLWKLKGASLFLARATGWAMSLSTLEDAHDTQNPWLELREQKELPMGLSFVWSLPSDIPATLESIINLLNNGSANCAPGTSEASSNSAPGTSDASSNTAPGTSEASSNSAPGTSEASSNSAKEGTTLAKAPGTLAAKEPLKMLFLFHSLGALLNSSKIEAFFGPSCLYLHPEHPKAFNSISLKNKREPIRLKGEIELQKLRLEEEDLKAVKERLLQELSAHRALSTLESNHNSLRQEIGARENEWFIIDHNLAQALAAWEAADGKLEKAKGGISKFFTSNKTLIKLQEEEAKAKANLTNREKAQGNARREREDFVREAKSLKDELLAARSKAATLESPNEIEIKLKEVKKKELIVSEAIGTITRALARSPIRKVDTSELYEAGLIIGRADFLDYIPNPKGCYFENIIVISPPLKDHLSRQKLLEISRFAAKRFICVADFSPMAWQAKATQEDGTPGWYTFLASQTLAPIVPRPSDSKAKEEEKNLKAESFLEELTELTGSTLLSNLTPEDLEKAALIFKKGPPVISLPPQGPPKGLGPFLTLVDCKGKLALRPEPKSAFGLMKLNIQNGVGIYPISVPEGMSLRAPSEEGPVSPVSALMAVKLALSYLDQKQDPLTKSGLIPYEEESVYIMCPSPTEANLVRGIIEDLSPHVPFIQAGVPSDFENFPQAPLVILDSAFAAPHTGHPWAHSQGKSDLIRALSLAKGAMVLLGNEDKLIELKKTSPLGLLYHFAVDKVRGELPQPGAYSFFEALDKAKDTIFLNLPPIDKSWYPSLAPQLLSAIRRRVKTTIFAQLPQFAERDYPGLAIRDLRITGANVHLSQGFPGFMSIIDKKHFAWGYIENLPGAKGFQSIYGLDLPIGSSLIYDLFQLDQINTKLGHGQHRNCPLCGWPFLLVNQDRLRGFGDNNSIKLGCLNTFCINYKRPRPLDERWPFLTVPICHVDNKTPYEIVESGRNKFWVCPQHKDGCPRYKVIPGDKLP